MGIPHAHNRPPTRSHTRAVTRTYAPARTHTYVNVVTAQSRRLSGRKKEEEEEGIRTRTRGKRQQENKKTKRTVAPPRGRLARRATIKIARSNRRAWCSFDVLYLSVILLSFPTLPGDIPRAGTRCRLDIAIRRRAHKFQTYTYARAYIYNTVGADEGGAVDG